ncbi:MAG: hypothetical protein ACRC8W_21640 [Plesiomonas shigelloides]
MNNSRTQFNMAASKVSRSVFTTVRSLARKLAKMEREMNPIEANLVRDELAAVKLENGKIVNIALSAAQRTFGFTEVK